ncbi:MAG: hypothetical protein ACYC64_17810 [Armatimonadota bacterium]
MMKSLIIAVASLLLGACLAEADSAKSYIRTDYFQFDTTEDAPTAAQRPIPGELTFETPVKEKVQPCGRFFAGVCPEARICEVTASEHSLATHLGRGELHSFQAKGMWAGNAPKFFQGAFAALLGHETGHAIANYSLNTDPYLKSVNYGPIPFFTIEPGRTLTNSQHYITASAGFNAQHAANEWILTKHPNLSSEDEPFLKGMASFNFWLTVGYAATAFAGTGPSERDTKGMADALGWNERWIGAMILVPTALDTYRYKHPDTKWAVIASRLSKLAIIALALDASD